MSKCVGCGVKLQYLDENAPGYVDAEILATLGEETYCQRCYKIIHHNERYQPIISNKDYYNKIDCIKDQHAVVLLMIDIMNIYGSFIPNLKIHIGENPLLIVVNKVDVIPKDIHLKNIENRIRSLAAKEDLNVSNISMISAKNNKNIENVLKEIERLKLKTYKDSLKKIKINSTYVLGCASTGKSTFINAVKKMYDVKTSMLTTSDQFQTTLDLVKIGLEKDNFMIDTPGLINYKSYGAYLNYDSMKILTPKNYLKPKTFQLNPGQTIFMGGLAQINFVQGDKINASFYVSNELYLHRTKTENASNLWDERKIDLLKPPLSSEEADKIKETKEHHFKNINGQYDLLISGIGFVHLVGYNLYLDVIAYKDIDVILVESFL